MESFFLQFKEEIDTSSLTQAELAFEGCIRVTLPDARKSSGIS